MNRAEFACAISPHPDDVALSISERLIDIYGSNVHHVTVFDRSTTTLQDTEIGEDRVSRIRQQEDRDFCAELGWTYTSFGYPDSDIRGVDWEDVNAPIDIRLVLAIREDLKKLLGDHKYSDIYITKAIGLHPDHFTVMRALSPLALRHTGLVLLYEDLPYAIEGSAHTHNANSLINNRISCPIIPQRKERHLKHYSSQLSPERIQQVIEFGLEIEEQANSDFWYANALRGQEGATSEVQKKWVEVIELAFKDEHFVRIPGVSFTLVEQSFVLDANNTFTALRAAASLAADYTEAPEKVEIQKILDYAVSTGLDAVWLSNLEQTSISEILGNLDQGELLFNIPCTGIVCAESYEDWLSYLSPNTKRNIKRKYQILEKELNLDQIETELYLARDEDIDTFLELQSKRADQSDNLEQIRLNQGYVNVLKELANRRNLTISKIKASDTIVAMAICQIDRSTSTIAVIAQTFDMAFERYSPGFLNLVKVIKYAHQKGYAYVDLLRGDESYKKSLTNHLRPMIKWIAIITSDESKRQAILNFIEGYEE